MHAARPSRVVLLVLAVLLAGAAVAQQAIPPAQGWVTDLAGFLAPEQEQALESLMQSYKAGSGHEIALLTVPDLGGRSLERYALKVGRTWGLGEKGKNNGALLLLARAERKVRIEAASSVTSLRPSSSAGVSTRGCAAASRPCTPPRAVTILSCRRRVRDEPG